MQEFAPWLGVFLMGLCCGVLIRSYIFRRRRRRERSRYYRREYTSEAPLQPARQASKISEVVPPGNVTPLKRKP
jgi:hypothetical protein